MSVDAHAFAAGRVPQLDGARAWREIVVGGLGIDAALDRMPARSGFEHMVRERLAGCDADLLLDQLAAHHLFGDRVLDLDPRVHFHEVEILALFIDEVLDRAGVLITDVAHEVHRRLTHAFAQLGCEQW